MKYNVRAEVVTVRENVVISCPSFPFLPVKTYTASSVTDKERSKTVTSFPGSFWFRTLKSLGQSNTAGVG